MKEGGVDERMKISEKGLSMIERFEGCLLEASNKLMVCGQSVMARPAGIMASECAGE